MLSSELNAIKHSKRSKITILFLFITIIVGEAFSWYGNYYLFWDYARYKHMALSYKNIYHPTITTFLAGNTSGQFLQIIIIWLLPMYLLLISTHRLVDQSQAESNYVTLSRFSKINRYLETSQLTQFIVFMSLFLILFGFDFLLAELLFHNGQFFMDLENSIKYSHLLGLELQHPNLTYLIYSVIVSAAFALFAVVVQVLVLTLKRPILIYPISLGIWFFMVAMPASSTYFIQPFIEYDWGTYLSSLISYLLICSIIIIGGNFWLKLRGKYVYFS
ncbi:hypothetical protein [Lentilactobacillus hilgardii]|uniref:hypothetical protein n=1 Tax=Lentilactobacillus hilgardii TaxID=1588 RepID=UPI003FA5AC83